MPRLKEAYQLDLDKVPFDFPELIAALAPRPFFTNSPTRDANFEVEGVKQCLTAAEPVFRLLGASDRLVAVYPDAEHDFPGAERTRAYEFLDRQSRPSRRDARIGGAIDRRHPLWSSPGRIRATFASGGLGRHRSRRLDRGSLESEKPPSPRPDLSLTTVGIGVVYSL